MMEELLRSGNYDGLASLCEQEELQVGYFLHLAP